MSFLGPRGRVARDEQSCIFYDSQHAAGVCLGTIQARTHVQLALANACTVTVEIWVMNVLTMPLHLGHSDLPLATLVPPAGILITLTLPCVLMAVTTSAKSWNDCSTREMMQRRFSITGVSVVFAIGSIVFLVHFTHIFYGIGDPALSLLFAHEYFVLQNK